MLIESIIVSSSILMSVPLLKIIYQKKKRKAEERTLLCTYLLEIQDEIDALKKTTYLQKGWLYENVIDEIFQIIEHDKLTLKKLSEEEIPDIFEIYKDKEQWLEKINDTFINNELENYADYFDTVEANPLTEMQRIAVVTNEENNLILAGAGSGKTSVVVAKVGYVVERGYATQEEVLLLAFNKNAQIELAERIKEKLGLSVAVKTFHALGKAIVDESYDENCSDFDEMISRAIKAIEEGDFHSPYRYIFVDEFQDISQERSRLLWSLREQIEGSNLTVVGDDWQGINQFAGSDLEIIQNFEQIYGHTATVKLDYSFRFNETIANASSKFVLKNPEQINKEVKTLQPPKRDALSLYTYVDKKKTDEHIESIINLLYSEVEEGKKTIKILSRYSFYKPKNLASLQDKYAHNFEISFNTVHGSKGLEADYVILTHLESGKFGFPAEMEAVDLEQYPYAEERRLFYVAMTRAKEKIVFMVNEKNPSVFMEEFMRENELFTIQ